MGSLDFVRKLFRRKDNINERNRILQFLDAQDLYGKTPNLVENLELFAAELRLIEIEKDIALSILVKKRYNEKMESMVEEAIRWGNGERRTLAGCKYHYRAGYSDDLWAKWGLEYAQRYDDPEGVAKFTEVLEYFESTGKEKLLNESYEEYEIRNTLMNITTQSIKEDVYVYHNGDERTYFRLTYPNDWRKYAEKVNSQIQTMKKMGLTHDSVEYRNNLATLLQTIQAEVEYNNSVTRNMYQQSSRKDFDAWVKKTEQNYDLDNKKGLDDWFQGIQRDDKKRANGGQNRTSSERQR